MSSRGTILAAALVAAVAAVLWLAYGAGDDTGSAAAPGPSPQRVVEGAQEVDLASPTVSGEPPLEPPPSRPPEARSPAPPAWSAPLSGRIVDRRTSDGVPQLVILILRRADSRTDFVLTDEEGRFESPVAYERSWRELSAHDALDDRPLSVESRPLAKKSWAHTAEAEELRWSIDIGPTFRVDVVGPEMAGWKARLVEVSRGEEEQERAWSWVDVDADEGWPGWVRYTTVEHPPDAGRRPVLQIADVAERWLGETPAPGSIGQHTRPLRVVVEPRAGAVHGTVSDVDGQPVKAHVLLLLRNADEERAWIETGTDDAGAYALEGIPSGLHRLMVQTDHRPIARFDVRAVAGEVTQHAVVLSRVVLAGHVTGALVGPPEGGEPFALLQLEAHDGGATRLVTMGGFHLFSDPDGPDRSEFEFEDLPAGRYRLSVLPLDGRRYDRPSVDVGVPAADVLFVTRDSGESDLDYVVTVRDAESGEVLPEVSLLWRLGPLWALEVETEPGRIVESGPPSRDLLGVVGAPGHLPGVFTASDFEREGESMRLELALERGHGGALVILDAERMIGGAEARLDEFLAAEGLAGARVVVRGRTVGKSDERGLALVRASEPIEAFEVRAPGWVEFTRMRFHDHERTPDGIGWVLMARE